MIPIWSNLLEPLFRTPGERIEKERGKKREEKSKVGLCCGTVFGSASAHRSLVTPHPTLPPFWAKKWAQEYMTCWAPKLTKNAGASPNLFEHLIRHHNKAIPHTFELNLHVFSKTSLLVGKSKMLSLI